MLKWINKYQYDDVPLGLRIEDLILRIKKLKN
jgi:hypothetical protein